MALGLVLAAGAALAEEETAVVQVRGTALIVTLPDGRSLAPEALVGGVLEVGDERGGTLTVRVEELAIDPMDQEGEIVLYRLKVLDEQGRWRDLCGPDLKGERWALPLAGAWTAKGEHRPDPGAFTVACAAAAAGKCVRLGYKPWRQLPDGTSLWNHHQACVRLLRADYCGDGRSFTRNGTLVDLEDRLGIQKSAPKPGMSFEAAWGKDGAVCVARPRLPSNATLDELARRCPARLAGRVGAACGEARAWTMAGTLLLNRSTPQP